MLIALLAQVFINQSKENKIKVSQIKNHVISEHEL